MRSVYPGRPPKWKRADKKLLYLHGFRAGEGSAVNERRLKMLRSLGQARHADTLVQKVILSK
ncbi:unnamed protein product, partial [Nesidiocoris tenuis]